jgi:acyl-CoA reductase-like NAD-dependent aldehyde dehydrogenase
MAVAIRQDVYIGGEWLPGDGEEIEVRSPATDELLGTVTASSPA